MKRASPAPRHVVGSARLSEAAQAKLERLVRVKGVKPTATLLGSSDITVEALRDCGTVRPETVVRIEAALARLR